MVGGDGWKWCYFIVQVAGSMAEAGLRVTETCGSSEEFAERQGRSSWTSVQWERRATAKGDYLSSSSYQTSRFICLGNVITDAVN